MGWWTASRLVLRAGREPQGMVPDDGGRADYAARLGVDVWRVRVARQ